MGDPTNENNELIGTFDDLLSFVNLRYGSETDIRLEEGLQYLVKNKHIQRYEFYNNRKQVAVQLNNGDTQFLHYGGKILKWYERLLNRYIHSYRTEVSLDKYDIGIYFQSRTQDDDQDVKSAIVFSGFGKWRTLRLKFTLVPPSKFKVDGKSYLQDREYSLSFSNELKTIFIRYGVQDPWHHNAGKSKSKLFSIPFYVFKYEYGYYLKLDKTFLLDMKDGHAWESEEIQDAIDKNSVSFLLHDYDGEEVTAKCHIEKRQWTRGDGLFKWLKYLSTPRIQTSLEIKFDKETGKRKGSWKGGTVGTSIEFLNYEELPVDAMKRFCEKREMKLIGMVRA